MAVVSRRPTIRWATGLGFLLALAFPSCKLGDGSGSGSHTVQTNAGIDWRDEVIYQVITDRFADGDVNNNWNVDRNSLARYQGGDWEGLIQHADYLQDLGVTTVWISPIVNNVEEDAGVAGYHGYWTQDFLATNPHFGDLGMLRRMVDALHARGIKVIVDIVTNHVGQLFFYDINMNGTPEEVFYGSGQPGSPVTRVTEYDPDWDPNGIEAQVGGYSMGPADIIWLNNPGISRMPPEPAEFQNPDWYHRRGRVVPDANGNWPADQTVLGDFPGGLKDLATERQDVRDALVRVFGEWIRRVDIDGFRIDTIKHVETAFWADFCPRIRQIAAAQGKQNFFMYGEAFDGDDQLVGSFTQGDMLDSVFYFPQKWTAIDGVIGWNAPTRNIENLWNRRAQYYGQAAQPGGVGVAPQDCLVNFIDNHDTPRFLSGSADDRRLRVALGFVACTEGLPCIYYGTEQGFRGSGDPANRERLWDSGYDRQAPLFVFTRDLLAIRRAHEALRRGDTVIRWSTDRTGTEEDAGVFAFERVAAQETALYVMNVNPQSASHTAYGAFAMAVSFPAGTNLEDLLDPTYQATVDATGHVVIDVPSLSQRILVAR